MVGMTYTRRSKSSPFFALVMLFRKRYRSKLWPTIAGAEYFCKKRWLCIVWCGNASLRVELMVLIVEDDGAACRKLMVLIVEDDGADCGR